jgi:hypothetical protein
MALGIRVEKSADHTLILRLVLPCLIFEELDAALAQGDGNLDSLFSEN